MGGLLLSAARFRLSDSESEAKPNTFLSVEAAALLRAGQASTIPDGALLFQEGQTTDRIFVVTMGEVESLKFVGGKSHVLATFGPGTVLGLMATLDGRRCPVSVRARDEVHVVEIDRRGMLALLDPECAAGEEIVQGLTLAAIRRLRDATDELAQTLFQALRASPRAGQIDAAGLARIQARNHAWPCVKLAA